MVPTLATDPALPGTTGRAPVGSTSVLPLWDENPTRRVPVVTLLLMAAAITVFFLVQPWESTDEGIAFSYEYAAIPCEVVHDRPLTQDEVIATLQLGDDAACEVVLRPSEVGRREVFPHKNVWLAVLVSMFLHGDVFHLAGNMLFLWVFGNNIEDHLGPVRYLLFFVASGVVATAAHVLAQVDSTVPVIGASGSIAGVMGAYLVWFPWARVRTLFLIGFIPLWPRVPAALLLLVWFVSQFLIGPEGGVAWVAHVAGFAFGLVVGWLARQDPRFRNRLWAQRYRTLGPSWDRRYGGPVTRF